MHATPYLDLFVCFRLRYLSHANLVAPLSRMDLVPTFTLGEVKAIGYRASRMFRMGRR